MSAPHELPTSHPLRLSSLGRLVDLAATVSRLVDRLHADEEAMARAEGWVVTRTRWGGRTYRHPVSVGRSYSDERTGTTYRPSMFLTLTLPSYGRVHPGGVPRDPDRYDYRRAALDAILFPRLLDRFWQNLRRCAGYHVQYFSAVEAQRRLAPHVHAAIRGTIPRKIVKAVAAATYHAAWWPSLDVEHYTEATGWPEWSEELNGYADPITGAELPTWDDATAELVDPAHVVSFGAQVDLKGLIGGTLDSDRAVLYLCKYLTKAVADTYAGKDQGDELDELSSEAIAYARHIDRLYAETSRLPCSPACGNWLRYGVQPKDAAAGLAPGRCQSPAHDRENLGLGGRRVLVSRAWSGKTLTEHKADRRQVIAQTLAAAGIDMDEADRLAADHTMPDGKPRFVWTETDPNRVDYVQLIAASLRQANKWRAQYEEAKRAAAQGTSPPTEPVDSNSATNKSPALAGQRREQG